MREATTMMKGAMRMALVLALVAAPGLVGAADHGSMSGMPHGGLSGGHDMMTMGDKVWSGKIGPWAGEARLMDMKSHMEAAKNSGMSMQMPADLTHHIAFSLTDPGTKKPVTEGKGTVTVTGPDGKSATSDIMAMQGHFGADVNLPKPGKYAFTVNIESGGKTGSTTFSRTIR